jgi:hypothetical protein
LWSFLQEIASEAGLSCWAVGRVNAASGASLRNRLVALLPS